MAKTIDLTYPELLQELTGCLVPGRTESHAFLLWFLQHFYRLDETEAQDAVCDGPDDKGIDAVYIDDNLETVDVFQCKLIHNHKRTLGDVQLKEFAGTLSQLTSPEGIEDLANTTTNTELASLLLSGNVAKKVEDGFVVRGIFLTNINQDNNARTFLDGRDDIEVFDKSELEARYVPVGPTAPIGTPVTFDVFGFDCAHYQIGDVSVVFAPLKANELIALDGIASNELFAWNVRGSLGRTKVNKDIGKSIDDADEHKNFLLYHNGLTILCEKLVKQNDKIEIAKYSVVNGCQSLTSLYDHQGKITDELRILARLIQLPPDHELAEKITHHSNNQNPISARDLQSNSTIQRRLQNEFASQYQGDIFYRIKRGERGQAARSIDNDEVGRLLLAFDLKEPWTCHQGYKILDELHARIFARPEVNAHRIVGVVDIDSQIGQALGDVDNKLLGSYRLTRYFLLYLVRQALELDDQGKSFCLDPSSFICQANGRARLTHCIARIVKDIVIDLNAEVRERDESDTPFDYKRELKSPNAVREITRSIIPQYQKAVSRGRASSFGKEWDESASVIGENATNA
ncbi:hypothetical protein LCGC14_0698130 [marine sediment metagenome]|uniref:Abortive phage infection protein C-terminal domain-containing protein n=1 Tax=marine sediment metagenome TaxID=412755 RepID=A0A0F9T4I0_9ZZZZ|nr:abortive phage infection protein [Phycisphaerae bacterium]HDZ44854.1 abortive phage infection protein [Phycisphaerae bacterium]